MDVTEEPDEIRSVGVVIKKFVIHSESARPWRPRNRGQRRDPIAAVPDPLGWCIAAGGPHSPPQWLQHIAAFIEKNDASFPFEALFLTAANRRGANGRWRTRRARALAVVASVDSSQACKAGEAHSQGGSERQRVARLCRGPAVRSTPMEHTPNAEYQASKRQPIRSIVWLRASVLVRDAALHAACPRAATTFSNDGPTTRYIQSSQPLPSMTFPARTAGLRSCDGLRALAGFLMVSCHNCSRSTPFFH